MIRFNIAKTIQASAYLLKQSDAPRQNYMRLLKLLYLSDRNSLLERGEPICGDTPFAMERGPVPSVTLDLIKGVDPATNEWERYFRRVGYDIELVDDPGNLALSRAEMNILSDIAAKFRSFDEWKLVKWCHKNLEEYKKTWKQRGSQRRVQIPLEDILEAIGSKRTKDDIIEHINADNYFRTLFGDHMPAPTDHTTTE